MSPRPKKLTFLQRLGILRERSVQAPPALVALVSVFIIALLATGIGYILYRLWRAVFQTERAFAHSVVTYTE